MYAVIFKAQINKLDEDYFATAKALRQRAKEHFNCVDFVALTEGDTELAISYWQSLEDIKRWKNDSVHLAAQKEGKERWYQSHSVQLLRVVSKGAD